MPGLVEELREVESTCEAAVSQLSTPAFADRVEKLRRSASAATAAFSGSWIGYHACTYISDLRPRHPNEVFDAEWGLEDSFNTVTVGAWKTYKREDLERALLRRASVTDKQMRELDAAEMDVRKVFDAAKRELLPILDALLAEGHGSPVREVRQEVAKMRSHFSANEIIDAARPKQWTSRDRTAMAVGSVVPPHMMVLARVAQFESYKTQATTLAGQAAHVRKYLERRLAIASTASVDARVLSEPMANSGGWAPTSFDEVVAQLDATTMKLALNVKGTRTCPAPRWDPGRTYRVTLVGGVPTIQRLVDGEWQHAPLEAPLALAPESAGVKPSRTTDTRLFISHSSADAPLARAFTALIDAALTVPPGWVRCTSVVGYKLEPGADGPKELRANLRDADVVVGLLTESSLASAYVLMELGAAWCFESWAVPLLGAGVDFRAIPGPMSSIHGVSVTDESGVAQLLETISKRCAMPWRADAAKRHDVVKTFVASASPQNAL